MKFARVENHQVQEIITAPNSESLAGMLHASLAANFVAVNEEVLVGWVQHSEGFRSPDDVAEYHVDPAGRKHPEDSGNAQLVTCAWNTELVKDGVGWRVLTDADRAQNAMEIAKIRVRSEIDRLSAQLTRNYTGTEEKGWLAMLAEAKAYIVSGNREDAPGLALDALIRGDDVSDRATAVVNAAKVTALIPSLASGMRARAEKLIDATRGDGTQLTAVLQLLASKGGAILEAASQGDRDRILQVATTGWDVNDQGAA